MGTFKHGILGGFRKKTGTVIGSQWRTLDVMRGLPRISNKKATQEQLDQRIKFGLVTQFVSNFDGLIEHGFAESGAIATAMNRAVAYHLKEAIAGVSPDFSIDLEKVAFSQGSLEWPEAAVAEATANQTVAISWANMGIEDKKNDANDTLTLMVYNVDQKRFFKLQTEAKRSEMAYVLELPASYAGNNVHVYGAFKSAIKKTLWSNTFYLGILVVL